MAHHIYTTPGFLVHSSASGEAGKYYLVFTRDLGMIGATAQGVRLSQSKLRYYTQDFALSLFSVVRGKEIWRMTGAKDIEGKGSISNTENRKLYVRILTLLKRLLPGEEKNERLFEIIECFHDFLVSENLGKEERESTEYLTVLRILNSLGYIHTQNLELFCNDNQLQREVLEQLKPQKDEVLKAINNALKESQL